MWTMTFRKILPDLDAGILSSRSREARCIECSAYCRILSHIEEGRSVILLQFEVEKQCDTSSLASGTGSEAERGITENI